MAENVQTDSDAGGQSQSGVGQADQTNRSLHQLNPNWVEDGHGIRGPQRQIIPQRAHPAPIDFRIDNSRNQPPGTGGKITVTTEDASGYASGSGVPTLDNVTTLTFDQDVFEIFDGGGGHCVVRLKTCNATCP